MIDMQTGFRRGGYVDKRWGCDLSLTRADRADPAAPRRNAREGLPRRIRAGTSPGLVDLPERIPRRTAGIGDPGPCGKILSAAIRLGAHPDSKGEVVIDKPGKGSFCATDLELILRAAHHEPRAGGPPPTCAFTRRCARERRGFECLLLAGCTGATDRDNHLAALRW
jgi:hypothetical protein